MAFRWDDANGIYRTEQGRFVPRREVRRAVDARIERLKADSDRLAERLASGSLDVRDWEIQMRGLLKSAHAMAHMAAIGGRRRMTASENGRLGARLKAQYGFLANFRREIAGETAGSPGQIANRARMYVQAVSQTYEANSRRVAERAGYGQVRRTLNAIHSCADCLDYAGRGWVAIGELPNPGEDCECRSACKCTMDYRRVEGEDEPREPRRAPAPREPRPPRQAPQRQRERPRREPPLPRFGPSRASVEYIGDESTQRRTREKLAEFLGRPTRDADVASLSGATDEAEVRVAYSPILDAVVLQVRGDGYRAARSLHRDRAGPYVHNNLLEVEPDRQGRGLGTRLFGRQVEQAARLGVTRIDTDAARNDAAGWVGYRVWPRLGYDGPIPADLRAELPRSLRGARRISDLMRTPEGRAWWDANGTSVDVSFDLSPDSLSRQVWDGYRRAKQRAARERPATEAQPNPESRRRRSAPATGPTSPVPN